MIGRVITKFAVKKLAKKPLSAAQKAALKKAQKASAAARRNTAIKKTESLGLKRVSKGTTLNGQRRISAENFKGEKGKALRKSTYKARLESSRAKYKQSSLKEKGKQKAIGLVTPTGLWRRKYVDLTTGENIRRNVSRKLKVGATVAAAKVTGTAAVGAYATKSKRKRKKKK